MKTFVSLTLSVSLLALTVAPASAAVLSFDPSAVTVGVGQPFEARLLLNSEGQPINALQATVVFPPDLLELTDVADGNTVINLWIEHPDTNQLAAHPGRLTLAGITPGGYNGSKGLVVVLRFTPKKTGPVSLRLEDAKTLLNDGLGTAAALSAPPLAVAIGAQPSTSTPPVAAPEDHEPPEPFPIVRARDPNLFNGRWFIAFATQDKGTGVDHYEARESLWMNGGEWQRAASPYELKDQRLWSYVSVKAVDRAGNERVSVLPPVHPVSTIVTIGAILLLVLALLVTLILRRKHARTPHDG